MFGHETIVEMFAASEVAGSSYPSSMNVGYFRTLFHGMMLRTVDMAQGSIDELLKVYMCSENVKVGFAQAKALELLALSGFGLP